jgi:hypothetical protein
MPHPRRVLFVAALGVAGLAGAHCSTSAEGSARPTSDGGRQGVGPTTDGGGGESDSGGTTGPSPSDSGTGADSPTSEDSGGGDLGDGGSGFSGDAAGRTPPTCATPTPSPNDARPGECDYFLQSLDFEDSFGYPSPSGSIKVTTYGQAFGLSAINECSPYCYAKNLTVGIDIVGGGGPAQLQGEIIVELPATGTGLPITAADSTRNGLAWITFDGAAAPPFEIDTQLVLETSAGIVPAVETKEFFKPGGNLAPFGPFNVTNNYSYSNGCEFKYFPMTSATGFPSAPTNVTGIGFRITALATAGQEWHGVAYIDHLQVRGAGGDNPTDAGAYPYGL